MVTQILMVNKGKVSTGSKNKAAVFFLALIASATPQQSNGESLLVHLTDAETHAPVEFSAIAAVNRTLSAGALTDTDGNCTLSLAKGEWAITITAVGYKPVRKTINLTADQTINIALAPAYREIGEVVVTASEGHGATSSSRIDLKAMEHLQPSSFTDLLELLPGSTSKDPDMGKANLAKLREATNISTDNYDTSSLGTSFIVDGVPMNTNAEMQATGDATRSTRLTAGKGVDMRALSTDDIESVEVVRGIPSAEYGEVTSGLIYIKRKSGVTGLEARFKADMQSQLFYVGKGVKMPSDNWTMNFSIDYLDSKVDPRNTRENFKRLTASVRSNKKWELDNIAATWASSVNYTGTFERDKNDPDLTVNNTRDYFTQDRNAFSWDNTLVFLFPPLKFLHNLSLTTGVNYADEYLHQEKTVASSRLYPMPVSTTPGDHYVGYQPMVYEANLDVYGKPLTAYAKLAARFRYNLPATSNTLKAGAEWNYSKNFGKGQCYDLMYPIVAGNTSRPRPFSDIPAMQQLSAYIENVSDITLGEHNLELQLGLRETQLLGLDHRYYLSNRPYIDPRINLKWTLQPTFAAGYPIVWEIAGGFGWHTKMPVAAYLFPDPRYTDFAQLNYFHNDERYRTMNVRTFVEDITNYDLRAARNFKWEIRADVSYRGNRLSVTYFREDMKDAFRQAGIVHYYTYNKYDASGFDPSAAGHAPTLQDLPFEPEHRIALVSHPTNYSKVGKEGVEFTFSSRRIPSVRTRVTVSGAWFLTTLCNSEDLWYKPSAVVNGVELQYAGLYNDRDGSRYQSFNTNFTFDTDIPKLKLNFSISVQNMWFTSTQSLWRNGIPSYFVGTDGTVLPWQPEMADDPYLKHLVRTYSATAFEKREVPIATTFNLKATKKLWGDRIGIALYVNRLLSITPDYYLYGSLQRRYTSPYFGMELNLKL